MSADRADAAPSRPAPFSAAPGETWLVAHTRPRCEKKFAALLTAERMVHFLPLVESVRQYDRRIRRFSKPLFPGYVFVRVPAARRARLFQQDLLARVIPVEDEPRFLRQIEEVRAVLQLGLAVTLRPLLRQGVRVRVVAGALTGVEGMVENPAQFAGVVIAVDVLQKGLLVQIPLENLQILP